MNYNGLPPYLVTIMSMLVGHRIDGQTTAALLLHVSIPIILTDPHILKQMVSQIRALSFPKFINELIATLRNNCILDKLAALFQEGKNPFRLYSTGKVCLDLCRPIWRKTIFYALQHEYTCMYTQNLL